MFKQKLIVAASAIALSSILSAITAMADDIQVLPEVRVTGGGTDFSAPGSLRDEIIKTESITPQDIEHANATNVLQALDNRPGIAVQVECSVCNVRTINLNNMPGRFATLLIDGIPLYSSTVSFYGLDSTNVLGVERIDVSRGAATSLIAPEALSGTVNIITKRPDKKEYVFTPEIGNFGSYGGNAYLATPLEGGAVAFSMDYRKHDTVDGVGMGISQYTGYERATGGLAYFLDDIGGFKIHGRVDLVDEDRGGGPLGNDYGTIRASLTGNPQPFNFSAGPHGSPDPNGWVAPDGVSGPDTLSNGENGVLYNGGLAGISQIITTQRGQGTMIGERKVGEGTLRLAAGAAYHYQDSFYGADGIYVADQKQYYLESSYKAPFGSAIVTFGANYRFEDLKSHGFSFQTNPGLDETGRTPTNGVDNYLYSVPGVFLEVYHAFLNDRLEVNGSVRYDQHNVFGGITSPRLNVLYHHTDALSSRFAIGQGFRAPTSFFEQEHGILQDTIIVRQITKAETSDNISYALNYASDRFSWTGSANYTRIRNFALLSPGQCDPADAACVAGVATGGDVAPSPGFGTATLFTSASDPVQFRTVDWVGTYQVTPSTALSLGLEKDTYTFTPGILNFSRPNERVYLSSDYVFGGWDLFAKLTWTGRQDLKQFYDYVDNQQYNLDGTPKPDESPSFSVVDVRAQYRLNKRFAFFAGVNNLFDYQQAKHDSFLWVDSTGALDVTHIWGPIIGRYVYAGLRLEL
ncbi:MAG TPA: TonB-dependent receptor [Burkholderiales bacterium]|nr:TonB-dependent receptor [Burkholderiales bacterium]